MEILNIDDNVMRVYPTKTNFESLLEHRYDLSTFATLDFVLPVFQEEFVNVNSQSNFSVARDYFCLFFDRTDNKFKVLAYTTTNNESSYGVKLSTLLQNCIVVTRGSEFKELALRTNNWFFRQNLIAMEKMFGDKRIKTVVNQIYNVLTRCSNQSKFLYIDRNNRVALFYPNTIKKSDGYEFNSMLAPIWKAINVRMDILGKAHRNIPVPTTTVFTYPQHKSFGFSDINFLQTAKSLLTRYKFKHRLYDFCAETLSKFKYAVDQIIGTLRD